MNYRSINRRMAVTAFLPLLFVLTMSFHYIPKLLHEIIGVVWFLLAGVHLYQNRHWLKSLRQGKWNFRRALGTVIDILLIAVVLVTVFAGLGISNFLLKDIMPLEIQRSIVIHQYHVSLPYALLILCGLHWGLHFKGWLGQWQKVFDWKLSAVAKRAVVAALSLAALSAGIYASFLNRIGDRLLMKHIFATAATNEPAVIYVLLLCGTIGLYVLLGAALQRYLKA